MTPREAWGMGAHVRCRQAVGSTRTAVGVADSKLFQMRSVVAVSPDRLRTMRESAFSEAVINQRGQRKIRYSYLLAPLRDWRQSHPSIRPGECPPPPLALPAQDSVPR